MLYVWLYVWPCVQLLVGVCDAALVCCAQIFRPNTTEPFLVAPGNVPFTVTRGNAMSQVGMAVLV